MRRRVPEDRFGPNWRRPKIYEGGLPAIAIRIVALSAQGHAPTDQPCECWLAIGGLPRDHFDACEAHVTAIIETERPRVNDGAHDAVILNDRLATDGECRRCAEQHSTEHQSEQNIAHARRLGRGLTAPQDVTRGRGCYFDPGPEIAPRATNLFQMNSTTTAPMVEVMKPAP